jgi:hypothetical protein
LTLIVLLSKKGVERNEFAGTNESDTVSFEADEISESRADTDAQDQDLHGHGVEVDEYEQE